MDTEARTPGDGHVGTYDRDEHVRTILRQFVRLAQWSPREDDAHALLDEMATATTRVLAVDARSGTYPVGDDLRELEEHLTGALLLGIIACGRVLDDDALMAVAKQVSWYGEPDVVDLLRRMEARMQAGAVLEAVPGTEDEGLRLVQRAVVDARTLVGWLAVRLARVQLAQDVPTGP